MSENDPTSFSKTTRRTLSFLQNSFIDEECHENGLVKRKFRDKEVGEGFRGQRRVETQETLKTPYVVQTKSHKRQRLSPKSERLNHKRVDG